MSSENTLTGREGKFAVENQDVARTTSWDVNPTLAGGSEWGDSDSEGYTNRTPGRRDCTFNAEGKYDTVDSVFNMFEEGDIAEAELRVDESPLQWQFPRALCNDFSMTVDIDTEEVVGWTSSWGSDGRYYRPGESP